MMNALLYFVKYPEPGMVKTRLAKVVGDHHAAQVYRELTETNLGILNSLPSGFVKVIIAFDPFKNEEAIRSWLPGPYEYVAQKGSELGARLQNAFQFAFEKGFKKVMALGSDTLGLKPEVLHKAFDALNDYDIVLGPAKDGGYYLIGLSQTQPFVFQGIPWSTAAVFEATLAKVKGQRLSYFLLPELEDLDEEHNLPGGYRYEILT